MPDFQTGREKVLNYLKENDIQIADLAVMYGIRKQDLHNYLNGHLTNSPMAKKIVLRIISDFKIR